ncbi:c-type cytochrome [Imbroritus primus]|uniref:c-type cytochrome n=1 Tax=Imbroritus primus TaxID=3058603 RepID=UPI003D160F76
MFNWVNAVMRSTTSLAACGLAASLLAVPAAAEPAKNARAQLGRTATAAEVKAWDIDVRPDFKGLPKGSGTVAAGRKIWDAQCASCHGDFGESNEVFTPLVGGTTKADMQSGHVAALRGHDQPYRTTLMKVSTISTLWDYIHRAMPWTAPKSLSADDVYAVTAYLLNLGDIVPADFTLSDANIAQVQAQMPNRNGMTTKHGMWRVGEKPDVRATACMRDCPSGKITSELPDHADGSHGVLAEQMRTFGPVRGGVPGELQRLAAAAPAPKQDPMLTVLNNNNCMACHGVDKPGVGPAFREVGKRYHGQADAAAKLADKIRSGGQGTWGSIPMPPQAQLSAAEATNIAKWIIQAK